MLKHLLPLLLFVTGITNAMAQQTQPVNLTLKDALKYALDANQDARRAKLDIENSDYQKEEVRARALPQITGSGGLNYNPILQLSAIPGELFGTPGTTQLVAFGQKWNASAALAVSQTLFDHSVITGLKAAKTTKEFYQLNAQLTDEQIIEQVATNYYRVLVQRQHEQVIDSTLKITEKLQGILQGLFENGLAKKIDVDRVAVNASNLRSRRQQLLNGVSLQENQLKFLMGMPIETPLVIPDIVLSSIVPQVVPQGDSIDVSGRTELMVLKTRESLLRYQRQATKGEYYPSLSLSGSYSYQGLSNNFPVFKGQSQGANWFDVSSVGLNLRIPIFNGFATRSRIRQADISLKKLDEDISQTKLSLNLAYQNAATQINNSVITLNNEKENAQLAQQVYSNTQNNYKNGLATLTDLLNAESALTEAQLNYSAALLDYRVAEIQLIKSQGNLRTLLN